MPTLHGPDDQLVLFTHSLDHEGAEHFRRSLAASHSSGLHVVLRSPEQQDAATLLDALQSASKVTRLQLTIRRLQSYDVSHSVEAFLADLLERLGNTSTSISELDLSGNRLKGLQSALEGLAKAASSLTCLNLAENFMGEEGVRPFAEQLATNTCLQVLDLSSNGLGCRGARQLSEALAVNTVLTELDLSHNFLPADAAGYLAEALLENQSLAALRLDGNSLQARGLEKLIELKGNRSLTSLQLSDNEIGPDGAEFLEELLQDNESLVQLDLSHNSLRGTSMAALAKGLQRNFTLTSLSVAYCEIDAAGAADLAKCFTELLEGRLSLCCLKELDLTGNLVACAGAQYLAEALKVNQSLENLVLVDNGIGEEGAELLAQGVKYNVALRTLNLSRNNFFEPSKFREALQSNYTLTHILNHYHSTVPEQDKGWTEVKDLLSMNKEGPIILQLKLASRKVSNGGEFHLELLKMSGEKTLECSVQNSLKLADFELVLQELLEIRHRRFVVLLPSGQKLHHLPRAATLQQVLESPCCST